jgi:hypothetical protein
MTPHKSRSPFGVVTRTEPRSTRSCTRTFERRAWPRDAGEQGVQGGSVRPDTRRLRAALAAVLIMADAPELTLVHRLLDSWRGVGMLVEGLHRVGYDVHLTQYGDNTLRATFFITGLRIRSSAAVLGSLPRGGPSSGRGGLHLTMRSGICDASRAQRYLGSDRPVRRRLPSLPGAASAPARFPGDGLLHVDRCEVEHGLALGRSGHRNPSRTEPGGSLCGWH